VSGFGGIWDWIARVWTTLLIWKRLVKRVGGRFRVMDTYSLDKDCF
jgi:hypothetical protein